MGSDDADFWDRRYRTEGPIWGDGPSPAAELLTAHLRPGARVLDVGFGYGRDLVYLGRRGCRVSGVEAAPEGCWQARARLAAAGVEPEALHPGRFGAGPPPAAGFDAALCHRLIHLLLDPAAAAGFAAALAAAVRPGGLLAVGARSPSDLDPAEMAPAGDGVYEYRRRPGHRVRYWTGDALAAAFAPAFAVVELAEAAEPESWTNPVPCRLTVMLARRHPAPPSPEAPP